MIIKARRIAQGHATSNDTSLYAPVSGSPNCAWQAGDASGRLVERMEMAKTHAQYVDPNHIPASRHQQTDTKMTQTLEKWVESSQKGQASAQ